MVLFLPLAFFLAVILVLGRMAEDRELIAMAAMARLDDAHERLERCGAEQDLVDLAVQCLMPAPAARPQSAEKVAAAIHGHLAAAEERVHEAQVEAAEAIIDAANDVLSDFDS